MKGLMLHAWDLKKGQVDPELQSAIGWGLTYTSMVKGGSKIGQSSQLGSASRELCGVKDKGDFPQT